MQVIGIGGVIIAGIVSFFSPCILPVVPVFISTLIGSMGDNQQSLRIGKLRIYLKPILRVIMFVLGLSTSFMILGLTFGALGNWFAKLINSNDFMIACGIIVILLGIYQTGLIKIPFLMREKKLESKREKKDMIGAFLLGFTFSFGWTPCVGPILGSVLALTATQGAFVGMFYMAIYALGLLIPFLVVTIFSDMLMGKIKGIYKYMKTIKIVGGIIIIIMGIFLATDSLNLLR